MSEVVAPWVVRRQSASTLDEVITQAGLLPLYERLKQDPRFFFFHTTDDFLTTPTSMRWAQDAFGKRGVYYDRGGHLGQVWTKEFQNDLAKVLGDKNK
jgi:hypothetical protein